MALVPKISSAPPCESLLHEISVSLSLHYPDTPTMRSFPDFWTAQPMIVAALAAGGSASMITSESRRASLIDGLLGTWPKLGRVRFRRLHGASPVPTARRPRGRHDGRYGGRPHRHWLIDLPLTTAVGGHGPTLPAGFRPGYLSTL